VRRVAVIVATAIAAVMVVVSGALVDSVSHNAQAQVAADPSVAGQWTTPIPWPHVAVHAILLNSGKVLTFGEGTASSTPAKVWDPASGTFTATPNNVADFMCGGQTALADGRIAIVGGGGLLFHGIADLALFDPVSLTWSKAAPTPQTTWYATTTALPDGRLLQIGGVGGCNNCNTESPSIYDPVTNAWTPLTGAATLLPMYPHAFIRGDGTLAITGASEVTSPLRILDLTTQTWTTSDPNPVEGASSAMYDAGKVIKAGSATDDGITTAPSASTAYITDLGQVSPKWVQTGSMAFPRSYVNLTPLPDGTVLATGGEKTKDGTNVANAVFAAEVWSPATGSWTTLASAARERLYHSVALLLPDGRVFVAGSGDDPPAGVPNQLSAEVFSPPYLFRGARPTITSTPSQLTYGTSFTVQTPDVASIASVSLIRTGAVTHFFDESTRRISLSFAAGPGSLNVQAPADANLAPPGYYMLFLVNTAGVPSVASMVQLPPSPRPAPAPGVAPVISSVAASDIAASGATITWTTDQAATSQVEYGTTSAYGLSTTADSRLVLGHSQALTGLSPDTLYHFRVRSQNGAGDVAASGDQTFRTAPISLVGDQAIEPGNDSDAPGQAEAFQFTASTSGSANRLSVYLDTSNSATSVVVGLYASDTAGTNPGALLAQGTIKPTAPGAWNSVTIPPTTVTSGTRYWIAVLGPAGGGPIQFRDVGVGGPAQTSRQLNLTMLPSVWSSGGTWTNSPISAYAAQVNVGPPDSTPPTVSMTAPANAATLSGKTTISATATDNQGVASVQFLLDGAPLGPALTAAPYSLSWDTATVSNGSHTLGATANDLAGNTGMATTVTVTVANPPTISNVATSNLTPTGVTITWTTNVPSTSQVQYGTTTAYGSTTTLDSALVTSHSQSLTGLTPSTTYHYVVVSKDASGNQAVASDQTFTTASPPPAILGGTSTIQSGRDSNTAGQAEAFQFVASASGSATRLFVYLDAANAASQVVVGIYAHNAQTGNPGGLLAQATLTSPTAGSWNSVTIPATNIVSGTKYWIAVLGPAGGGTIQFRDTAAGTKSQTSSQTTLTSLPATWSPGTNWNNSPMSAYVAN
jgi:hypothetical protein